MTTKREAELKKRNKELEKDKKLLTLQVNLLIDLAEQNKTLMATLKQFTSTLYTSGTSSSADTKLYQTPAYNKTTTVKDVLDATSNSWSII